MTVAYKNAFTEVSELLKFVQDDLLNKIPKSFLRFIENNKSKTYVTDFNTDLPLSEQEMLKETKIILSLIYRSYLCDEDKRKKLKIIDINEVKNSKVDLNKNVFGNS